MKQHKIAVTIRVDSQRHVSTVYASVAQRSSQGLKFDSMANAEFQALRRNVEGAVQEFVNAWIEGHEFLPRGND